MTRTILCLLSAFSTYSYSQVGIGVDSPKATLDISVSNSNSQSKSITINSTNQPTNALNKDYLTLYNDGSLNIGGAFKPGNNPGVNGSYLISNGPNMPPTWQVLQKKIIFNAFQAILNNYQGTILQSGVIKDVYFSGSTITNLSGLIGTWDSEKGRYRINKEGNYLISWNTKVGLGEYPLDVSVKKGYSLLYYGTDKTNYYLSPDVETGCGSLSCDEFYTGENRSTHLTGSSIYLQLKAGDYISLSILSYQNEGKEDDPIYLLSAALQIKEVEL